MAERIKVKLEKCPGKIKVEYLHIILLLKAGCNFNNKWLCQLFMKEDELANMLANKQYGRCHFWDAITQCLNKCLWYNYIWFYKEPAALCSNNAKICYDHFVWACGGIVYVSVGSFKIIGIQYDEHIVQHASPHSNSPWQLNVVCQLDDVGTTSCRYQSGKWC